MYREKPLDEVIEDMRNMGERLIPHNPPKAPPTYGEDDLAIFKTRDVMVDGYDVTLHYSKADYDSHLMETLQIYGRHSPFLPFSLICKMARKFLGGHELSLVELFKENRKIYCWYVCVDRRGRPMPLPYDIEVEQCNYEGFNYLYTQPDQVNFI